MSLALPFSQINVQSLLSLGYGILLMLITLAIGWALGRLVGALFSRLVVTAGGESLFRHTAIGRALMKSGYTAGTFSKALVKWIIYLTAFLIGLEELSLPIITDSVNAFLNFLPALVSSIIILIVGVIFSDWIGEFVKRSTPPEQREALYIGFIGDLVKIIFYFVTVTIALADLKVDLTILYIIAQALAWALAIFVGVAAGIVVGWILKDKVQEILPH